ncbi:BlaI/MecI/CopY family transcriptional regulator [Thermoleophilia bacterium SCSIO 60948]|nr:BlaI/MecI/CopY family transcriptional regulator [Thermoleophilia bacterium SCSIO 60948]
MTGGDVVRGDLQLQVIRALWALGRGSVEDVRSALPGHYRGAYTTIQTVLNRLVDRELLVREKAGKAFIYEPAMSEADYVSRSIHQTLAVASDGARLSALARLVGELEPGEVDEIRSMADRIARMRTEGRG